jgi:hypothetical protein
MRRTAIIVAALSFSGVAFAQQNPMSYEALAKSKQGQWAEYTMSMKGQPQTIKMRYALVEKTPKTMGLEVDSQTPMGPVLMHMQFDQAGTQWKLHKARMQLGANPAQDMPQGQLAGGDIKKGDLPGKLIGTESIKTPAGTFSTKHYQKQVQVPGGQGASTIDVWMNDKAMPTGLVKMSDAHGATAVLTAMGSDAKPKMDMTKATTAPAPAAPAATPAKSGDGSGTGHGTGGGSHGGGGTGHGSGGHNK